ncbi:hypothetical protein [Rhodohalobacter halophilus]|uniref:hypothetical protein n=1 Tax=Rhodohalobacter halophilus TaxID=1812810 RepID=UPI00083F72FB|nr:hypothetical protein [Rhodohalobacter halophilus]
MTTAISHSICSADLLSGEMAHALSAACLIQVLFASLSIIAGIGILISDVIIDISIIIDILILSLISGILILNLIIR